MANVTSAHLATGAGGFVGGAGLINQIAGVLTGHGVEPVLAYNEAGLIVTGLGLIGMAVWAIFRTRYPATALTLGASLQTFEPDLAPMAAAVADEIERRAAKPYALSQTVHVPDAASFARATQPAPTAPVAEPPPVVFNVAEPPSPT